ncbi:carbohydrate ABC transporter permease [soil metagenome]
MKLSSSRLAAIARDVAAIGAVCVFLFPLIWWAYVSIQPYSAIFNKDQIAFFNFEPTMDNYRLAFTADEPDAFSTRAALIHSIIIACGSTTLAIGFGTLAAYGLSRFAGDRNNAYSLSILSVRCLPPIAVIIPATLLFHQFGIFDTHLGVIAMHAVMTLPLAILMLKSFIDEIPRELDDAARIDGATNFQTLTKIIIPMARGGIAATAVLCLIFSYTEFLMSLFLTVSFRTIPVTLSILPWGDFGQLAAAATAATLPSFVFILLLQRHLVRGLTLGIQK